uniref:Uncharacterized protein n=1 Tax=Aegilops tauschii subsp. strangulata TaxID=200361 RepID=A0A453STL9_AEGTS
PCRRRLFSRPHLPSACHYPAGAAAAASSSPPATHLPLLASRLAVTPLPPPLPPHIRPARWNTRLRQEYLYRKSLKGKECQHYEKRCRIQEVLGKGKPIPTKLRNEGLALRRKIDLGDQDRAGQLGTACVCLSDSYRRKDTFSFLLDGQQHNRNNRSIR